MITIIAGGRNIKNYRLIEEAVKASKFLVTCVVSGCQRGADTLGERWADEHKIPVMRCPADWERYGKSAGPRRNRQMGDQAEGLIAVWDGKSKGTKDMIEVAKSRKLKCYVHMVELYENELDIA